jgi:flagellar basal body-associated protein FliL
MPVSGTEPGTTPGGTNTPGGTDTPDDPSDDKDGLGAGAIIGIIVGALVVLGGGGFALYWFVLKKKLTPPTEPAPTAEDITEAENGADNEEKEASPETKSEKDTQE